jgi:O-antigen/teichoic acid export membrane protein
VISNTGWLVSDRIMRMGVGLLVSVWLARYLGPGQYGLLNYAMAFVMLFSSVAMLGLDEIGVREMVQAPSRRDDILGTSFFLMLCCGTVVFGLAMGTIILLRPADSVTRWLVGILAAGIIFQAFDVVDFWFQAQVQSKYTVIAKGIAYLVLSLIKIILILLEAPLVAFAWAGLAELAVGAVGLVIAYELRGHRIRAWQAGIATAQKLLRDSWPLIFSAIVTMIYLRIDQVMLGEMAGSEEVGVYAAAVRIAEAWYFIPVAVCSSVFPGMVEAGAVSEERLNEKLQKLYNLMAFSGYAVAIPFTFLSDWLVELLFGAAYARAGSLLAVLVWAGLFINLVTARNIFLISRNWNRLHLVTMSLGCVLNVVLNYFLIPLYGAMGSVIASLASYWLAAHGSCFLFSPLYKTGRMMTMALIFPRVW